jgi:hypothetical protein
MPNVTKLQKQEVNATKLKGDTASFPVPDRQVYIPMAQRYNQQHLM